MTDLHDNAIVIDGLIVSKWSRKIFEDMRRGGLTAANCTCSIWEGFQATMNNVADWNMMLKDNSDLIMQVTKASDILAAKNQNKTGIILGFQNVSAFEDQIRYVEIFKKLGVGIVQMAYNTQNLIGTGCYETVDRGLSDFGREIVTEMNRVGILCDLSHVGSKTSEDVILTSSQPVCYSHCLPSGLKEHPRNKTDEQLKFIADRGGFVGVTMFPPFLAKGTNSTIEDYVTAIDYVTNLIGEDCVGIGTDFTQDHGTDFFEWLTHDKGYARKLTEFGEIKGLDGIETIGDFPNLTRAMQKAGWNSTKIEKIIGGNWLRLLTKVWGE